jgi:hypothetical protein
MRRQQFEDVVDRAKKFHFTAVSLVYHIAVVLVGEFAPKSDSKVFGISDGCVSQVTKSCHSARW